MELQINYQGLELVLTGTYIEAEKEVNFNADFEIGKVESLEGTDLTELFDNVYDRNGNTIMKTLQNLATEKLEK